MLKRRGKHGKNDGDFHGDKGIGGGADPAIDRGLPVALHLGDHRFCGWIVALPSVAYPRLKIVLGLDYRVHNQGTFDEFGAYFRTDGMNH